MRQEFMTRASKCHKFLAHAGARQHAPQARHMKFMLARVINSWRMLARASMRHK